LKTHNMSLQTDPQYFDDNDIYEQLQQPVFTQDSAVKPLQ